MCEQDLTECFQFLSELSKLVLTYTKNVRGPWLNNTNCEGKA